MAVLEEPKYPSAAVILIIKSLFPLDSRGCSNFPSLVTSVTRTRAAWSPSLSVSGWLLGARGSLVSRISPSLLRREVSGEDARLGGP